MPLAGSGQDSEHLEQVGLVVWQSAFVLAEYLLRNPPFGQWQDVHAVDLGAGTGEPCWRLCAMQVIPFYQLPLLTCLANSHMP